MSARIRCPEGCPDRKPGCHDEKTCECWARQLEQRRKEREARWGYKCIYPQSWAQRGILNKKGELKK